MSKKLSTKEAVFVREYVSNGQNMTKASGEAGYALPEKCGTQVLQREHVQKAIQQKLKKFNALADFKCMLSFDDKRRKLQHVINQCIDVGGNIDIKAAELALKAIALDNDMTGDKAAEKRVNANFDVRTDADIQQAAEIMKELMKEHESDH